MIASGSSAQAPIEANVQFRLDSESTITIEGTSTVNSFSCISKFIQGYGSFYGNPLRTENSGVSAEIAAQVKLFDCGKSRMNKDFWKALQSDRYPIITYALDEVSTNLPTDVASGEIEITARGTLTIAGIERPVVLQLLARRVSENFYRATGTHEILMSDFNVEPPTALFGLIKARDNISILFDLKIKMTTLQITQN